MKKYKPPKGAGPQGKAERPQAEEGEDPPVKECPQVEEGGPQKEEAPQ
jgi:hypothetical protein